MYKRQQVERRQERTFVTRAKTRRDVIATPLTFDQYEGNRALETQVLRYREVRL